MTAQPIAFSNGSAAKILTSSPDLTFDSATNTLQVAGQTVELPILPADSHLVYVSLNGSDLTGTGTILEPYQTIAKAQDLLDGTNKTVILLMPGTYTENVTLKPNVFLLGYNPDQCELNGTLDVSDILWASAVNARSGVQNLKINGGADIDFSVYPPTGAQFICIGGVIQTAFSFTPGTVNDQCVVLQSLIIDTFTINGGFVLLLGIPQQFSPAIDINSSATIGTFLYFGGACLASAININYTNGDEPMTLLMGLYDKGATINVDASAGSAPGSVILSGSIPALSDPINYINDGAAATAIVYTGKAKGAGYTPTTPADWSVVPVNIQEALDELAARVIPTNASEISYTPFDPFIWPVVPTNVQEGLDDLGVSGSVSINWQGPFAAPVAGDLRYARVGDVVFLSFDPISDNITSNTVITNGAGGALPIQFYPAGTVYLPVAALVTNGNIVAGSFSIDNGGNMTITVGELNSIDNNLVTAANTNWITGVNGGWNKFCVSYIVP